MIDEIVVYRELSAMRDNLVNRRAVDYDLFARSMVSNRDAGLLRNTVRTTDSGEVAGDVIRSLYTQGGVGNLTSDISVWLERDDDFSDVLVSSGLVLWGQTCDLYDGTAMRALFEFSHHESIRLNRDRALEDIGPVRSAMIMQMSREEQVSQLIGDAGESPGARLLYLLRTYVDITAVQQYLERFIRAGRVSALASAFFQDVRLEWDLFDNLEIESDDRRRIVLNLAIENCIRGAEVRPFLRSTFGSSLSLAERAEVVAALRHVP